MTVRRPRSGLLAVLTLLLAACAGDGAAVRPDGGAVCPPPPIEDAPALPRADAAAPDAAGDAAAGDDAAPRWALPPCETACDRLVDCAVTACPGFEWTTAGTLAGGCHEACDDGFVAAVAGAPDCAAVLAGPGAAVPSLAERCAEDPCRPVCERVADCVVAECPALGEAVRDPLAEDCVRTCVPDDLVWVASFPTCGELVATLTAADPPFAEVCQGGPTECADPADCDAYGARIASCLVANCGGRADPYESGLGWAFAEFCRAPAGSPGEPCAPASDVAVILDPTRTCADAPFADLGTVAPFAGLCQGTNGVTPESVRAACDEVLACAGESWLPDVAACMALLVLRDDAAAVTGCIRAAEDCGELFACLEESER